MPLRMKCTSCARELALDPVFLGASCRCYHCRNLVLVPSLNGTPLAAKVRPAFPAMAIAGAAAFRPALASPLSTSTSLTTRFALNTTKSWMIAGVTAVLVGSALTTWMYQARHRQAQSIVAVAPVSPPKSPVVAKDDEAGPIDTAEAIRTANPRKCYFGVPLEGNTIGFVVDDDQTMAPYIDHLSTVTNGLIACLLPQNRKGWVVRPVNGDESLIVEAAQPAGDLEGARSALVARLPSGKTDFVKGLAKTQGWYADQLFLVISKALAPEELAVLTQTAEQTGAVTHVIAFGAAAKQDLAPLADATHGRFIPVSDELLTELAGKYVDLDPNQP
jgi:hypothetical protein